MIYEYAVDPKLVASWGSDIKDYRYYYREFGLGTARIVSGFPSRKKWRKKVLEIAQNLADLDRERAIELLRRMSEKMVSRNQVNYNENISWENNAIVENQKLSFDAIFTIFNHKNYDFVLIPTAIDNYDIWEVENGRIIDRNSIDMVGLICPMLQKANKIIFIDPHFMPNKDRYKKSFKAFFSYISAVPNNDKIIEIHCSYDDNFERENRQRHLSRIIPPGLTVFLKRWKEREMGDKLHNRYVLTDLGGVSFSTGLDEGGAGQTDDVRILTREEFTER